MKKKSKTTLNYRDVKRATAGLESIGIERGSWYGKVTRGKKKARE